VNFFLAEYTTIAQNDFLLQYDQRFYDDENRLLQRHNGGRTMAVGANRFVGGAILFRHNWISRFAGQRISCDGLVSYTELPCHT
jgi:hypothetical protein